jgi:hypothetical protein
LKSREVASSLRVVVILSFIGHVLVQAQWVPLNGPKGGVWENLTVHGNELIATRESEIIVSTDGGLTWNKRSDAPPDEVPEAGD